MSANAEAQICQLLRLEAKYDTAESFFPEYDTRLNNLAGAEYFVRLKDCPEHFS